HDEKSLTSWCVNHQKSIVMGDIEEEYKQYVPSLNISTTKQTAYSRIHIPLTVKDKRIGILVINSFNRNAYTNDDLISMQTVASYISIALDNAKAYEQVNEKSRAIQESISYSKSIQNAFMPTQEQLDKYLNTFVLFKPKDIVSGDFYWFSPIEKDNEKPLKAFVAVADCTGHGVPGALVSSIGNNLLDRYINFLGERNPAQILEMVNVGFQLALKQDETRNNDGMDMALIYLEAGETGGSKNNKTDDNSRYRISFSGAKSPILIYRAHSKELEYHRGSRKSIGGLRAKRSKQFYEKLEFVVESGDIIYLFTDGIIDQHSPQRERFTKEKLVKLIKGNAQLELSDQCEKIEQELKMHQEKEKQTDDITIMGIQL
ncbi:MAG: SpoIIE family protein phosphatase, partial [Bacteroidales bacterium]|nr:SpoIIE family protein phosphatase [Bacteroidales bacterium]